MLKIYKKINRFYRKKMSEMDEDRRCTVEGALMAIPFISCVLMFYGILEIYKMFS